jgi:hypothetical protein
MNVGGVNCMELKFNKKSLHCMRPFFSKIHTQEQTQEIRLPDAYPDIGKVIGCWGQILMRGKEWHSSFMGANGGVMAWVMYAPEDGTPPRVLDVWIPIQCRWDFQESVDDGEIAVVLIDDEATVKRVYFNREDGILTLMPENPTYKPMRYTGRELDRIRILGKVVSGQYKI